MLATRMKDAMEGWKGEMKPAIPQTIAQFIRLHMTGKKTGSASYSPDMDNFGKLDEVFSTWVTNDFASKDLVIEWKHQLETLQKGLKSSKDQEKWCVIS